MNILHISPYYPDIHTNHAGGVCMGKEIETLSERHMVCVLTFISQPFDEDLSKKHEGDERWQSVRISRLSRILHMLAEPWMPAFFAARSSLRFSLKLISMVRKYHIDAIHAEYASMGQYMWIKKLFPEIKFNIVEHDVTAQMYDRKIGQASGIEKHILRHQRSLVLKSEGTYCRRADNVLTLNEKDRQLIRKYYGRDGVLVINTYSGLDDELLTGEEPAFTGRTAQRICFLGQMGRPENDRAARRLIDISGRILGEYPEMELYIVGNRPSEELKKKAEEANRRYPGQKKRIIVTGFVDDVDSYIKDAIAAVFPLDEGAGIKSKVLRSMALGVPVVTGHIGAEGIDPGGEVIMLAETDEEYAACMRKLLGSPDEAFGLGLKSREYIKKYFLWSKSRRELEKLYG